MSTELHAIYYALKEINLLQNERTVICTDSIWALKTLSHMIEEANVKVIVHRIVRTIMELIAREGLVIFIRIPSLLMIAGNLVADNLARQVGNLQVGGVAVALSSDAFDLVYRDFTAACALEWPFFPSTRLKRRYFTNIGNKSPRPWFRSSI